MNYINKMHRWGRIWAVVTCTMVFAFPFALAIIFGAWPNFGVFLKGLFGVAVTFWPVGIIEVIKRDILQCEKDYLSERKEPK